MLYACRIAQPYATDCCPLSTLGKPVYNTGHSLCCWFVHNTLRCLFFYSTLDSLCLAHVYLAHVCLAHFCLAHVYNTRRMPTTLVTCQEHSSLSLPRPREPSVYGRVLLSPASSYQHTLCTNAQTHTQTHTHTHILGHTYMGTDADICTRTPTHAYAIVNWGEFRRRRFEGDFADVGKEVQIAQFRKCA
jgi:hypothetical protein